MTVAFFSPKYLHQQFVDATAKKSLPILADWKVFVDRLEPELLQFGDSGNAVKALQLALQSVAIYDGSIDGNFGSKTETAVQAFQTRLELEPSGIFDSSTWYAFTFWTPHFI